MWRRSLTTACTRTRNQRAFTRWLRAGEAGRWASLETHVTGER